MHYRKTSWRFLKSVQRGTIQQNDDAQFGNIFQDKIAIIGNWQAYCKDITEHSALLEYMLCERPKSMVVSKYHNQLTNRNIHTHA